MTDPTAAEIDDGLREALRRARNDLLAYGRHNDGDWQQHGADPNHRPVGEPCRCGLDEALAYASAALGEQPQGYRDEVALARRASRTASGAALAETPGEQP